MRHGVDRPRIARVQRHGLAATRLGVFIAIGFLEPEGMHAEQVAVAGHIPVPMGQHLRDAVAQHRRLAEQEIAQMGHLHGEDVARIVDGDVTVRLHRLGESPVQPGARGGQMAALAQVGAVAQGLAGLHALAQQGHGGAVARGHHQRGAQCVAHGEVGVVGQRGIHRRQRVAVVAMQQRQPGLIVRERGGMIGCDFQASCIGCHGALLVWVRIGADFLIVVESRVLRFRSPAPSITSLPPCPCLLICRPPPSPASPSMPSTHRP
ncbi:hypothetical protein D3C87_1491980 [compost metagenome]